MGPPGGLLGGCVVVTSVGFFEAWGLTGLSRPSENDPGGSRGPPKRPWRLQEGSPAAAWALLGAPGRLPSRFGRLLGRSGALLASLGRLPGRSWRLLNGSWSALGGAEVEFGRKAENRRQHNVFRGFYGLRGASWGLLAASWGARTASWHDRSSEHVVLGRQNGQFAQQLERTSSVCSTVRAKTSVSGPSDLARPRGTQVTSSRKVVDVVGH